MLPEQRKDRGMRLATASGLYQNPCFRVGSESGVERRRRPSGRFRPYFQVTSIEKKWSKTSRAG